ncbi:unnamed protein product [Porites lobata]|uniref:Bro-N domain-containing protein n=1 Tax=Porites lobata TaxID=104759 RepID=A0ABN8PMD3_9CNID|nr:unnamed protein product [Porites lobata]
MLEKRFNNAKLGIELTSYVDNKQNIWFQGKDVAKILGYSDTAQAIRKHVDEQDKYKGGVETTGGLQQSFYINESGFYSLVLSSKLETAKKFKKWVTSQVLPSIRKYGYYKLFDNPNNKMFKIANEMDLHCKVVQLIRCYYPDVIMVAGLGENQDTAYKRIISWKKGYLRGQPDLMILNNHKDFNGLCIEFKSPTNKYQISDAQKQMKERYKENCYKFILSNDYDDICMQLHKYMAGVHGMYSYSDINDYIHQYMDQKSHHTKDSGGKKTYSINLTFVLSTYRVLLSLNGNYQLDLRGTKFGDLIGFEKKLITKTEYGTKLPNITNSIDVLNINTSAITDSIVNGINTNTIAVIPTDNLTRSYPFTFEPKRPLYCSLSSFNIAEMRIYVTDSLGRPVNFNGIDWFMTLILHSM